ncbi:IQ calmodulin-binding motif family protein, putative [Ichthyophthirius multifiliis]|uniref:IQ calmodulin-binding motif family protein, putative n=1 Tax=Ichthyophthirius multifiliis TaxID=5932 RepID=G0QT92_ICHMU|nr:IQ calmodulin-binding motif family protein, putative [Ichthyophthirius multifiliis]EGR31565.1 IQ calmodulin-binding motif family protein, putative [Ichthyophthirius multifiliis]|eukprot:XP_004035051.1 IQ calmodulin-binding motif family protein, putative [Ichthyophthirius multifiliis]
MSDLDKGLINLVNQGFIPKDLDLNSIFNQGTPVLSASRKQQNFINKKLYSLKFQRQFPFQNKIFHDNIDINTDISHKYKLDQDNSNRFLPVNTSNNNLFITSTSTVFKRTQSNKRFFKGKQFQNKNQEDININQISKAPIKIEQTEIFKKMRFFVIKNGQIQKANDDFKEIKNENYQIWGSINGLIKKFENLAIKYQIKLLHIDTLKLIKLIDDLNRIRLNDLISCIPNQEMVKKVIPAEDIGCFKGKAWATIKIICSFRMRQAIRDLQKMKLKQYNEQEKKQKIFVWLNFKLKQRQLKQRFQAKIKYYEDNIQKDFKKNFKQIFSNKRIEIHLNSLSISQFQKMTMENYKQKQNLQISRIFAIKDPNVEIIYISPYQIQQEIINYYFKILELGECIDFKDKIHFIYPENLNIYPETFSTSKLIFYCPKALNKIKQIIQGKQAILIPGKPSQEDIQLGIFFQIPIFSGPFELIDQYSKKSQAKILFDECQFPSAPGADNIKSESDLFDKLTILISKYSNVNIWLFKIDNEINGRGIAFFNLETIRALTEIRKQKTELEEKHVLKIREIIESLLPFKIQISMPTLFQTYQEFLNCFLINNGIIEACPLALQQEIYSSSILFKLNPDSSTTVMSSYDKLYGSEYVNFGCNFPQTSLPQLNIKHLCNTIGNALHNKGIYGYITINLIAFPDPTNKLGHPLFWIIGLDCYLNDYSAIFFIFDFLIQGKFDRNNGKYFLSDQNENQENSNIIDEFEERTFMYIPYIFHQNLKSISFKEMFNLCRKNGISYDVEKKVGSVFLLVDEIEKGIVSLITISENQKKNMKQITEAVNLILQIGTSNLQKETILKDDNKRVDQLFLINIASKVRQINKAYETQLLQGNQNINNQFILDEKIKN